jgi:osmotically-inducible protein OsmY
MPRRLVALAVSLLVGCGGGAPKASDPSALRAGPKAAGLSWPSDSELGVAVSRELADQRGAASNVAVEIHRGIVMLSGSVGNAEIARRVVLAVRGLSGVRAVIDRLEAVAPLIADATLQGDIERALAADPALARSGLRSSVRRGSVRLVGNVDSFGERQLAEAAAWPVGGVIQVTNDISLRIAEARSDAAIESDASALLAADPLLGDDDVQLDVVGAVVQLRGEVASSARLERAKLLAWVPGTVAVDSRALRVASQRSAPTPDDTEIESAVSEALDLDPRLARASLVAGVRDGRVTLRGRADSVSTRTAAEADAENAWGVLAVDNQVRVASSAAIADSELAHDVSARLASHPLLTAEGIRVEVDKGMVTLSGQADSAFERAQAEATAAAQRGVETVVNALAVVPRPVPRRADAELLSSLRARLENDAEVAAELVGVKVQDGVVLLEGSLPDWDMVDAVLRHAFEEAPRAVVNRLERRPYPQRPSEN